MTIDFPTTAPTTPKELFARLRTVLQHGPYDMPVEKRYGGHGGPGVLLTDLLGSKASNQAIADATGWEVKWFTDKTNYITLFHREAQPENIMRWIVRQWGWKDEKGRMSFRHTIAGKSDRCKVSTDDNQVTVRRLKGNGACPYWTHDDLINAAAKLKKLLLVKGEKNGQKVRFIQAELFQNMHIGMFVEEMGQGTVVIDFDAREAKPGSDGLRNHGTKFRVKPSHVCRLYMDKTRFKV